MNTLDTLPTDRRVLLVCASPIVGFSEVYQIYPARVFFLVMNSRPGSLVPGCDCAGKPSVIGWLDAPEEFEDVLHPRAGKIVLG